MGGSIVFWRLSKDCIWASERHFMLEMMEYLHWAQFTQERSCSWCCPWRWKCNCPHGPTALEILLAQVLCCQLSPLLRPCVPPIHPVDKVFQSYRYWSKKLCPAAIWCSLLFTSVGLFLEDMKGCPVAVNSVFLIYFFQYSHPWTCTHIQIPLPLFKYYSFFHFTHPNAS